MESPRVIKNDNVEYIRKDCTPQPTGDIRIVILQRGWVAVGYLSQDGVKCRLDRAAIVRKWGTTEGLPEIARKGPTINTILDKSPAIHFHELTIIASIECVEEKWASVL